MKFDDLVNTKHALLKMKVLLKRDLIQVVEDQDKRIDEIVAKAEDEMRKILEAENEK